MVDDVPAGDGAGCDGRVTQVAAYVFHTQRSQLRVLAARDRAYRVAAVEQLPDDGAAKESAATGDQSSFGSVSHL